MMPMQSKKLQILLIVLACLIIYVPSLGNGYVWDDDNNLYQNQWVQRPDGLKVIWFTSTLYQYYPVHFTTFWLEHKLWGFQPFGYHVTNLILHIINALLFFWVVSKLYPRLAFIAALLFAVHPIQVETVAWVTERKNLLSLLFFLWATLSYLRFDRAARKRDYAFTVLLYVAALLSKSIAICFAFVPVLYAWWRNGKVTRREIWLSVPLVIIGTLIAVHTLLLEYYYVGSHNVIPFSILQRIILAGRAVFFYPHKLLVPLDFIFFYPAWKIDTAVWWQWLFPLGVILTLAALVAYRRKTGRGAAALFIFYLISIFPVLGFLNVYGMRFSPVADHFSYLSTPGLILFLCAGIASRRLAFLSAPGLRAARNIFLACVVLYLCGKSMSLTRNYKNEVVFWNTIIRDNPSSWVAYNNLGAEYVRLGEPEKAIALCRKTLEINPQIAGAYCTIGEAQDKLGRKKEAIESYQRAIAINPNFIEALNNLAAVYVDVGETEKAIGVWEQVVKCNPFFSVAHFNLATFYYRQGKYDLAIQHCDEVIRLGNAVDPQFLKLLEPHRKRPQ